MDGWFMAGPPSRAKGLKGSCRGRRFGGRRAGRSVGGRGPACVRRAPCVNWPNRSISGPSEFDRIERNAGASLPIRMLRASAEPSPPKAATRAARPATSALLLNRITSASACALAVIAAGLVLGRLELGLGDLELLLGQGHGDLLLLLGLGRLLDDRPARPRPASSSGRRALPAPSVAPRRAAASSPAGTGRAAAWRPRGAGPARRSPRGAGSR